MNVNITAPHPPTGNMPIPPEDLDSISVAPINGMAGPHSTEDLLESFGFDLSSTEAFIASSDAVTLRDREGLTGLHGLLDPHGPMQAESPARAAEMGRHAASGLLTMTLDERQAFVGKVHATLDQAPATAQVNADAFRAAFDAVAAQPDEFMSGRSVEEQREVIGLRRLADLEQMAKVFGAPGLAEDVELQHKIDAIKADLLGSASANGRAAYDDHQLFLELTPNGYDLRSLDDMLASLESRDQRPADYAQMIVSLLFDASSPMNMRPDGQTFPVDGAEIFRSQQQSFARDIAMMPTADRAAYAASMHAALDDVSGAPQEQVDAFRRLFDELVNTPDPFLDGQSTSEQEHVINLRRFALAEQQLLSDPSRPPSDLVVSQLDTLRAELLDGASDNARAAYEQFKAEIPSMTGMLGLGMPMPGGGPAMPTEMGTGPKAAGPSSSLTDALAGLSKALDGLREAVAGLAGALQGVTQLASTNVEATPPPADVPVPQPPAPQPSDTPGMGGLAQALEGLAMSAKLLEELAEKLRG